MRKIVLFVFFVLMLAEAGAQMKKDILVTIKNPRQSSGALSETISISWKAIIAKMPGLKAGNIKVYNESTNAEVPYQIEYSGLKQPQNLLLKASIIAGKSIQLRIAEGKSAIITPKVYGRYVPERKDDFAWENDKIAFRMYGKALEPTSENAFGLDVWAKRTDKMVVDKWYQTGDYHADHGDGLDFYSVGHTLGAGDIAPVIEGKILFPKNYRTWEILDNGPLRFAFVLKYDEWDVAGRVVKVSKHYTLDAGSQLNRVEATFTFDEKKGALKVAAGLVLRKEPNPNILNDKNGIAGYWEPEHGADGILGVGTIMMQPKPEIVSTPEHLLTFVNAKSGKPVIYYNGAAWSKGGNISSSKQWFSYLEDFRQTLTEPLIVILK